MSLTLTMKRTTLSPRLTLPALSIKMLTCNRLQHPRYVPSFCFTFLYLIYRLLTLFNPQLLDPTAVSKPQLQALVDANFDDILAIIAVHPLRKKKAHRPAYNALFDNLTPALLQLLAERRHDDLFQTNNEDDRREHPPGTNDTSPMAVDLLDHSEQSLTPAPAPLETAAPSQLPVYSQASTLQPWLSTPSYRGSPQLLNTPPTTLDCLAPTQVDASGDLDFHDELTNEVLDHNNEFKVHVENSDDEVSQHEDEDVQDSQHEDDDIEKKVVKNAEDGDVEDNEEDVEDDEEDEENEDDKKSNIDEEPSTSFILRTFKPKNSIFATLRNAESSDADASSVDDNIGKKELSPEAQMASLVLTNPELSDADNSDDPSSPPPPPPPPSRRSRPAVLSPTRPPVKRSTVPDNNEPPAQSNKRTARSGSSAPARSGPAGPGRLIIRPATLSTKPQTRAASTAKQGNTICIPPVATRRKDGDDSFMSDANAHN
jgi:hypothetical protein